MNPRPAVRTGAEPRLPYRPELDGIRAVAVLMVIANHAGLLPDSAGTTGVTIFFVLSGYLITSILQAELRQTGDVSLRDFYVRRARRLLPALALLLLVTAAVVTWRGELGMYVLPIAAAALYWADFAPLGGIDLGLISHTWSLSLEEQFYALWPVVFRRLRDPRPWLLVLIVTSAASQFVIPDGVLRPLTRADAISAGCLLALVPIRFRLWPVAIAAIALVVMWNAPPFLMTVAAVLFLLSAPGIAALRHPVFVRIGQISYGLYLWHFVLFGLIFPWPLALAGTFAVALASERWVERPLRARRKSSLQLRANDSPGNAPELERLEPVIGTSP
jgi:peptidoglycan/LPS O-acetylase OafA/YrhL